MLSSFLAWLAAKGLGPLLKLLGYAGAGAAGAKLAHDRQRRQQDEHALEAAKDRDRVDDAAARRRDDELRADVARWER